MLYVDVPTSRDLRTLSEERADACVSIYLPTTPVTLNIQKSRIAFGNLVREAVRQLEERDFDKRRLQALRESLDDLADDNEFWKYQAHSLAVLATPDRIRTYRLANRLEEMVEVSDRFHLKPLIRAITFPHTAYVLAVSENAVRLVEVSADLPATTVDVADLPADVASVAGDLPENEPLPSGPLSSREDSKTRLTKYIRRIDAALRPLLIGSDIPVILAAAQPVASLFRSISAIPLLEQTISGSHDRTSEQELANAARPILDAYYAEEAAKFHALFETRMGQRRATTDMSDAARAATFGDIDQLLIDIDNVVNGFIDEETGAVTFDDSSDAKNYGVVDEIARRALQTGARVMGVRREDIPDQRSLAAILRRPI